jgi:hypothetical protein
VSRETYRERQFQARLDSLLAEILASPERREALARAVRLLLIGPPLPPFNLKFTFSQGSPPMLKATPQSYPTSSDPTAEKHRFRYRINGGEEKEDIVPFADASTYGILGNHDDTCEGVYDQLDPIGNGSPNPISFSFTFLDTFGPEVTGPLAFAFSEVPDEVTPEPEPIPEGPPV